MKKNFHVFFLSTRIYLVQKTYKASKALSSKAYNKRKELKAKLAEVKSK